MSHDVTTRHRTARFRARPVMLVTAVGLLLGAALYGRSAGDARPTGSAAAHAQVWVTSERGERLRLTGSVAPSPTGSAPERGRSDDLVIEPAHELQPIVGFGAAMTHSSAALLNGMTEEARRALLMELFLPGGPVGLSIVRVPLGGSDFVTDAAYTYDDLPPGQEDWELASFSTAVDEPDVRSLLREIRAIAPRVKIIASPWSPPAWMKTSASLEGGHLIDEDRVYSTYAAYLVRALQEYAAAGVPIDALTVQNEPQARHPDGYPGTDMPVAAQLRLLESLGPALQRAGLTPTLLAFDHNWQLHPADAASTPEGADPEPDYAAQVLRSSAARWVGGTAFHCYSGDASAQEAVHDINPDKAIWVTECSGSHGPGDAEDDVFAATLAWQSRNLLVKSLQHWAGAVLTWNLALDPEGGPHVGGCDTCTGVVTIDGSQVTRNAEYYVLAHAARFIPAGAHRVRSDTTLDESVSHAAFLTPDRSVVVIAANAGDSDREVEVEVDSRSYAVRLSAHALTTVIVPGPDKEPRVDSQAGRTAATASYPQDLDMGDVTAAAVPPAPADSCCSTDDATRAVDGDPTTRWSSGRPQRPGDHLDLDLGRPVDVHSVILDAGPSGDWPREYEVLLSADGRRWDGPVARGAGAGAVTGVELSRERARFVRIRLTGTADVWWSVADVRVLS